MKITRMEYVGVVVDDLELGVQRFGEALGLNFEIVSADELNVHASDGVKADPQAAGPSLRMAFDSDGLFELVEYRGAETGFRNVHFRVSDISEAVAELSGRGMTLLREFVVGGMKEAIFDGDDLWGIRVCLVEYEGTSIVAAMRSSLPE